MDLDKNKLVEAAHCGLQWLEVQEERKGGGQWKHKILKRLCNAVIASGGQSFSFIAKDVCESESEQESGSQLNKVFRKFDEHLENWAEGFNQVAIDNGLSVYLTGKISQPEKHVVLELGVQQVDSAATVAKDKVPEGRIRYNVWERKALPHWQQRLLNRDMGVGTHLLLFGVFFVLVPIAMVIFTTYSTFAVIYQPSLWFTCIFVGALWAEYILLRWLYDFWRFHERKIMMLPIQFTSFEQPPTALIMRHENGKRWPVIHALTTSANCLFCDGTVYLCEESHSRYRVLGACSRHPTEHRFTFDYTNMLGRALVD